MKTCTRFHFGDVERGDRLVLTRDISANEDAFEVIVCRAFRTSRFGEVVEDMTGESYYLIDFDDVRSA